MGRVRHAGSLIKSDGHSYQKYWCVVREKAFLVYDDIEHGSIAKSPSCVLPVSHLSATAYVLPSNNKRAPTQFSLELHCAESDRTFIFYVDQAVALEQWVDAIKAEASSDEVTFFDSPHGALLPPELEFLPATANKISYRSLPPSSGETTARTMKYLNDIRKQTKLDIETKITEIPPDAKVQHSPNLRRISPRLPYKESTDTSKHSLPDVIPTYQDRYGDDDSSMTSLSSPALSTPSSSSRHHNYQESADESSISSSNASSPVIVKSKKTLKSSPYRPKPTSQTTKKKQTKRSHPPSKDQWMREPLKRQEKVFTSPDTPQQQKDRRSQGNPYFYTGENKLTKSIKSTPGMRHVKKKDSTKRHTITGVVSPLDLTTITNAAESANDAGKTASAGQQPSTRQPRLSIAPLSTLDLQINQRRRHTRPSVQVELAPLKQEEREFSFDSDDSEDSSFDDFNDTSSRVQNSPTLFDSSELLDNFQPAGVKREKQGIHERLEVDQNMTKIQNNEGMRTPILRLKKKIKTSNHPASGQQSSRSGPDLPNRSDFKRRSGNFSTKLLNRVSSVVGRRSNKSFDDPVADKTSPEAEISPTCSFTSVTAMESGANVQEEQQAIFVPPKESFEQKCSSAMEGFLYRRKRMQWKRVWAILTSDKVLNFYKSENYEPVASINLKLGCSAENVVQDKNSNSFVLVFKTTSKRSNSSNSIEDGQLTSNKQESTTKSVHLMCKSTQEFMHWMKAFVLLNSSPDSFITASKQQTIRTLNPIKPTSATGDRYHDERSIPGIPSLNSSLTSSELESLSDLSRSGDLSYISAERVDLDVPGGVHKSHSSTNVNELIARCNVTPVQRSSSFDTDSKRTVTKIEKSPKALSRHTPGMMAPGTDDITSACGQVSKVNANSEQNLENLRFIRHPVNPESPRSQTETCLDAKSRNDSQYPDDSSNKKTKAIEDTTRTTYGEKIMSIVAPVAADRKTDVDGYKVISTARTSAGNGSLTGNYEGANRLTTCNKWTDVAANLHHSTIENDASPTATLSNSARSEQSEVESKKHDRLVMTNKAELGAIFDEKIPCDPEICNCCNLTDMELAGESSGREEISIGSSESAIEPRKQTSPRCGRSSDDKEQFSPSALFSLDRPVQKTSEEVDPSIATVADLQAGGSDGEEFDQQQKKERAPSVTDRITLFEKLTSAADDCNDPTSRTVSSTQECSELRENTTSNFISSGTLTGGSCVWDVKTDVSDDESIDLQNLLSNLSDRKLTYNASLSDKPESTKYSRANSTSFKARKLLRSTSDSNLLDPTTGEGYRMRIVKKPVPELTKIDFIEIYSFSPIKSSIALSSFKALDGITSLKDSADDKRRHSLGSDSVHNKSSVAGSSNSSKSSEQKSSNETRQKTSKKSTGSASSEGSSRNDSRSSWLSGLNLRKNFKSSDDVTKKNKTSKTQVLRLPASQLTNATHRGYLDRRGKKKQWERFWCVFQDTCLYCYNSPQSDATRDVVLLRGYDIIADVTNMNRSRFVFRLEQQGAPTFHFSSDNHQEFLLWVGTLEKETRSIANNSSEQSEKNKNAKKNVSPPPPPPITSEESNEQARKKTLSQKQLEQELAELQKQKLLKEIATQQQQIIEEQRILDRKASSELMSPLEGTPVSQSRRASRRSDVIEKYDRVREEEEMKMTKYMTHLNRRRNSAQLKVDQLAKEIAPKSGKKRRQNHEHFAALEGKLNEMKEKLGKIDNEIHTLQANKQSALEKIRERQDLELLLAEQQESLAIMRRHDNDPTLSSAVRHRHRIPRSREALTSIDEISSISDCCSSGSTDSVEVNCSINCPMSSPRAKINSPPVVFEETSSESVPSEDLHYLKSLSRSVCSLDDVLAPYSLASSMSSFTVEDCRVTSKASENKEKNDRIDPAVLAGIEMFEEFSKKTLEKLHRN